MVFLLICSLTLRFLSSCLLVYSWLVPLALICCYVLVLGNFIYISKPENFSMDFQMPSTVTHDVNVCLYLRYLMPSRKPASLKIYLHCPNVTSLIFNLTGFHGQKWVWASVPLEICILAKVNTLRASEYSHKTHAKVDTLQKSIMA